MEPGPLDAARLVVFLPDAADSSMVTPSTWQVLCERLTYWVPAEELAQVKVCMAALVKNVAFFNAGVEQVACGAINK